MWIRITLLLFVGSRLLMTGSAEAALPARYAPDYQTQATAMGLAHEAAWLKLLHYKKRTFGGYESEADGEDFFISPEGKSNPAKELAANIEAFTRISDPGLANEKNPICRFPARYLFLKSKLRFSDDGSAFKNCRRYLEFKESIAAKSASIIFSSYYLNNPASAFGHSLLRLNKNDLSYDGTRYELLDNGINYAAVVTQENPVLYAFMGVFGLFKGTFTRIPYYYKVREYNDFESRDLWVYDLNLTQEQVDRLVDHVWELGSTHFDYYYLSENCSYHILTALEAAVPELGLSDRLPYVVVPADTIKVITKTPGLVNRIQYRPSVRSQFLARLEKLSPPQIDLVKRLASAKDLNALPESLSDADRASVLDAAIDYVDFKDFRKLVYEPEGAQAQWKQRLLVSRAKIPVRSETLVIETPQDETPHSGHDIMRAGVDVGGSPEFGPFTGLQFRFALHDLIDSKRGYPEYAQIEFFNTRLRYLWDQKTIWVDDLALFRVISLTPWTTFDNQVSWKMKVGGLTVRDRSCDHCFAGHFEAGGGVAFTLFKNFTAFTSIDTEAHIAPGFAPRSWLRPGMGPSLLLRYQFNPDLLVAAQASYRYRLFTDEVSTAHFTAELRWAFAEQTSINLKTAANPDSWEASSAVYFYF